MLVKIQYCYRRNFKEESYQFYSVEDIKATFVIMYRFDPKNSEKLFVRPITTICSAGNPSQQFKYADKNYVNQMKPLLIAMKYTGLLPICISKSGKLNVRYSIEEFVDERGYVTARFGKVYFISC